MRVYFSIFLALLVFYEKGQAQGFVNLNFNSANIPSGTQAGDFVPISDAIPDWTGYYGTDELTSILYNSLATGSQEIALLSSNSPGAIPGNNYTVVIQATGGSTGPSTSLAQTALIPSTAESLLFTASLPYSAGWQVTIGGQVIPVTEISTVGSDYAVYGGNISAFAGQVEQLEFSALAGNGPSVNLYLDSVSFSPNLVPEPNVVDLFVLGGLFLAWRYRQIFSKAKM